MGQLGNSFNATQQDAQATSDAKGGDVLGTTLGTAGSLVSMSDERLKKNITKLYEMEDGINIYSWDWTDDALQFVGDTRTVGVIAQEVQEIIPEAVSVADNGYLQVDYSLIFKGLSCRSLQAS